MVALMCIVERIASKQLLQLMTLLSPMFPIGSFSYSHGFEQVIYDGLISCAKDMEGWVRALLRKGTVRNDAIFLAEAWRSIKNGLDIRDVAQLACAMSGSREREMENCLQGEAFLQASNAYGLPVDVHDEKLVYPIAVGLVCARLGIGLIAAASAYLHCFVANLVQVGLRLVPLGQKEGIKILNALENDILTLSQRIPGMTRADLGSAAIMLDICAMRHETLYSRNFRS